MTTNGYRNDDLFQTSTGVGHHYRPGYYFPSSNFRSVLHDPLPGTLVPKDATLPEDHYKTTYGTLHDLKHYGGPYRQEDPGPIYKKAPALGKVNYTKDLHEKIQSGGYRRPLTMGNQITETHEQFRHQPGMFEPKEFLTPPKHFNLNSHHNEGPAKRVVETTSDPKMKGRPYFVKDKGILDLLDPYLTTTNQHHRIFKPKELDAYPRKDNASYYVCEEYPKAWGHGPHHNPLPKASVPYPKDEPMRDELFFKSSTKIRRIPNSYSALPHSHMNTLYKESYVRPADPKSKEAEYCPVDTPYTLPKPGPKSVFSAPGMYKTEYTNVGSQKPITI